MSLKKALQTRREHNMSTDVLFVDLVKAFDTVNHEFLYKVLHKYGYPIHFINIIRCMYLNFELTFSSSKAKKTIPYTIGVHQGNNLAPILFNIFFQAAIDALSSQWITHQIQKPTFNGSHPKDRADSVTKTQQSPVTHSICGGACTSMMEHSCLHHDKS